MKNEVNLEMIQRLLSMEEQADYLEEEQMEVTEVEEENNGEPVDIQ